MLKRLDHVGIVVDDLDEAKRFLSEVLGLSLNRELEVSALQRRSAFFQCGDATIEIIEDLNVRNKERNLRGMTANIEHIAIEVDDLSSALGNLERVGVRTDGNGVLRLGDRLNAWTDPESTHGIMFQLFSAGSR